METLVEISKVAALLGASALCVYLIVVLMRFNKFLEVLQQEVIDLNKNLKPILENLNTISEKLRQIATKVDDQVNIIHGVFIAFKHISDNITRFEERIQQRFEEPLLKVGSLFGNLISRLASFIGHRVQDMF